MGHDLAEISLERFRILLPGYSTQALLNASVGLHALMVKYQHVHTNEVNLFLKDLLRKSSMVERELSNRCVTKEITKQRMRGNPITPFKKIEMHISFRKWLRHYVEAQIKKHFYYKTKRAPVK